MHDVRAMDFDRLGTNAESSGHHFIGLAGHDQMHHFALARGKGLVTDPGFKPSGLLPGPFDVSFDALLDAFQ